MPKIPVIPESAPFSEQQRLWLNGFFAGLVSFEEKAAQPKEPAEPSVRLLILFGSQTGTAQNLARRVAKEANARGVDARVVDAAAHGTISWDAETNLFVITSTYGDGDMPDNAQSFWDWLKSDSGRALAHLKFAVLALGDTNYTEFCAAGKKIDARLEQLGAQRIHARVDCDVDYESNAKAWAEGALSAMAPAGTAVAAAATPPAGDSPVSTFSRNNPFPARLLVNRRLNEGSEKETRHYEISLEGSGLSYEAGDALGVLPVNCAGAVSAMLQALGCDGEEAVTSPDGKDLSLRLALATCYEIARPGAELLQAIASHNPSLASLLAPERKDDLKAWIWGRDIIDLLLETPQARFEPAQFVALLKKLAPRLYSIASSPKAHPGQVHLTINTVRYQSHGRARKGLGSTFLADRVGDADFVKVFVQPSHGFKPPERSDAPMIMVGPGTGVAPFRSFLHERRATGAKGRNWLFFGEQRSATDFYYRDELEQMLSDRHLTKLSTAFSRDQSEKIYVQRRLLENAGELWSWLQEGAHFYVCGDASRMAKDVDAALHQAVAQAGQLGSGGAVEYVNKMRSEKRYQRDVY
jgi:sulfite reductase (NADPH) flavoprotein alpha-component